MCSEVFDLNSGWVSVDDGQGNGNAIGTTNGGSAGCVGPYDLTSAEGNDGEAYFQFWDMWNVQDEMGIHAIQRMEQIIQTDMTSAEPLPLRVCIGSSCPSTPAYDPVGPLVSNTGLCLQNDSSNSLGVFMEPCSWLSGSQTWQTATMGQTGSLGLSNGSACVDDYEWMAPINSVESKPCSGSSGELFTVTSANELRWGRNESLCLTAETQGSYPVLQACDGQPHQQWSRNWPASSMPTPIPVRFF
jgi:hypothetical protein